MVEIDNHNSFKEGLGQSNTGFSTVYNSGSTFATEESKQGVPEGYSTSQPQRSQQRRSNATNAWLTEDAQCSTEVYDAASVDRARVGKVDSGQDSFGKAKSNETQFEDNIADDPQVNLARFRNGDTGGERRSGFEATNGNNDATAEEYPQSFSSGRKLAGSLLTAYLCCTLWYRSGSLFFALIGIYAFLHFLAISSWIIYYQGPSAYLFAMLRAEKRVVVIALIHHLLVQIIEDLMLGSEN